MRRDVLLAVVACLALVGCGAPSGGPTTDTSRSATSTPVPTAGTPTPNDTNTVAFATLPPASREAFETTLRPGSLVTFVPDSPYIKGETFPPEAAAPFVEHEYVEQEGAVFRVELTRGQLYATYRIEAPSATPEPDATVVDYQNVTDSRQQAVRAAIENGSYSTDLGQWSSAGIDAEYVRYEGKTYELEIAVGDYWGRVFRVEPV